MSNVISPFSLLLLLLAACGVLALLALAGPMISQALGEIQLAAPAVAPVPVLPPLTPPKDDPAPLTREQLAGLPLTEHAKLAHPEREWGAPEIREQILADRCRPVEVYVCSGRIIITCGDHSKTDLGLVVGTLTEEWNLVTGFPSDNWLKAYGGCWGPYPLP